MNTNNNQNSNSLDRFGYKQIPLQTFLPFTHQKFETNWILHQDNDPKHKSLVSRLLCEEYGLNWVVLNLKLFNLLIQKKIKKRQECFLAHQI